MTTGFRVRPPTVGERAIERPRLAGVLDGRFDRRITLVTAGPGFGKTTLLAAALARGATTADSVDLWTEITPADNGPDELASTLRSLLSSARGVDGSGGDTEVWELIWAMAPLHVAVFLDDVHHLRPDTPGTAFLAELIARLPRNGHLVLAGRDRPVVPLMRLQAAGEVVHLDEADLAFDDGELDAFLAHRGAPGRDRDEQLRWPALAELAALSGSAAVTSYLWEEVLAGLDPALLRALALLAPLGDDLDDELVEAVTGRPIGAAALLDGLPLTTTSEDGRSRLHALWAPVLASAVDEDDRAEAMRAAGAALLRRGDLRRAGDAYALAGDTQGVVAVATAALDLPSTRTDLLVVRHLLDVLPDVASGAPRLLLEGLLGYANSESGAAPAFERAAEAARREGDIELEALASWRAVQIHGLTDGLPCRPDLHVRVGELAAAGSALAAGMVARHAAYVALDAGDVDGARAQLGGLAAFGPASHHLLSARLLLDLGRPEEVTGPPVTVADVAEPADAAQADLFLAQAIWLRGDMDPSDALAVAEPLVEAAFVHHAASITANTVGIVVSVALAAGRAETARDLVQRSAGLRGALGARSAAYLDLALAAVAFDDGDEALAADVVAAVVDGVPLGSHPPRQYLHALPLVHLLAPSSRRSIEDADLGPALTVAVDAARAGSALRAGDPSAVGGLAWDRVGVLRAHVPPSLLVELALVAAVAGSVGAAALLESLPTATRDARRALNSPVGSISAAAREWLADRPSPPRRRLELRVLGAMELLADGVPVSGGAWGRERVRTLLGVLVDRREVRRRELGALLWPDLDEAAAARNLRVNLAHLNGLLQPERPSAEPPWFVQSIGDTLRLNTDGLTIDAVELDRLAEGARHADARGEAAEALGGYLRVVELYRGRYLADLDEQSIDLFERIRTASAAALAATRAAELLLARGEPEQAMRLADRAISIEPLFERAHLARIRAVSGTGDRAAARATAELMLAELRAAGMTPEPASRAVLASLGVTASLGE